MDFDGIRVRGACEHNLRNIDVDIPRNQLTVITGLSGSGKSSLAFDTIYAEGQRRYIESLSAYARQFLEQLKKPKVSQISGLSPSIAIDQKSVSNNPRSTVGTVTEVYDFLRLLFAKVGSPLCPEHGIEVTSQNPADIVSEVMNAKPDSRWLVLSPVARGKKGEFLAEFKKWNQKGFSKARVDGNWIRLESAKKLTKNKFHDIDLVIDQIVIKENKRVRIAESINTAIQYSGGRLVMYAKGGEEKTFSIHSSCPECGFAFPELEPRLFSFNHPRGYCQGCHGLGTQDIEEEQVFRTEMGSEVYSGTKWTRLSDDDGDEIELTKCPDCKGQRLRTESLNVLINGCTISRYSSMSATELLNEMKQLQLDKRKSVIGEKIIKQIVLRLGYLDSVGAGYLSLDRPTPSLSGGEAQRIRLASQLGSALIGVLYILDEPSIGLHPRDHQRLLDIILQLKNRGNTVLVVEHDEDTIRAADFVIDIGPGAGKKGGELVAKGTPQEIVDSKNSITGNYLSGRRRLPDFLPKRSGSGKEITVSGARGNNLKNLQVKFPLSTLTSITGVSGSGKSTLVVDTLYRIIAQRLYSSKKIPAEYDSLEGIENIDKVIQIDQSPIGRTPRSTPATYIGLFPMIRELFANLPESKMRGYKPGRFSFNVVGGRCEQCQGQGQIKVEMHFLSNVFVPCSVCRTERYNRETLLIKYKGKNIADILNMSAGEALEFFRNHKHIYAKLEVLNRVGLDYLHLGQSSTTLSGGEAQRVKLSRELSKRGTGKTLYILDEPTTGLHFEDVRKLVELLHELVSLGNTVLVIEHNLDVILASDYVIDLGPEGGMAGGQLVAAGTPEQVSQTEQSETGKYLRRLVEKRKNDISRGQSSL